jgi:hypothetical protein
MKLNLHAAGAAVLAASLFVSYAQAADKAPAPAKKTVAAKKAKPAAPSAAAQIQELREALEKRIDKLEGSLAAKDAELKQAQQQAAEAKAEAAKAQAAASAQNQAVNENSAAVSTLQSTVKDLKGANASLAAQVSETSAKSVKKGELSELAFGKVKIGGTFFGDYSYWTSVGYAPYFIDSNNANQPTASASNAGFNSFNITRAYLNFTYTPNDWVSLRITPDIYRQKASTVVVGGTTYYTTNDTSLSYRLKLAYVEVSKLFDFYKPMAKDKVTFGQMSNSLIGWEDGILGNRFTYTAPWNYLGLSSTYVGLKASGPVVFHGLEYLDYDLGVYSNAAYTSSELSEKKQFMGRVTAYPFGTKKDTTGLGVTVFGNFGYNTSAAMTDTVAKKYALDRMAAIVSYQTADKAYGIVGEYDMGANSYTTSTLFPTSLTPAGWAGNTAPTSGNSLYAAYNALSTTSAAKNTRQQGFAFQGNARLGGKKSPFTVFGLYQYFRPNVSYKADGDAFDFARTLGGVKYNFKKNLDIAVGDQNFRWLDSRADAQLGETNAFTVWSQFNF